MLDSKRIKEIMFALGADFQQEHLIASLIFHIQG